MMSPIDLNTAQKKIMHEFYSKPNTRISLTKSERKKIWDRFVLNRSIKDISHLETTIPALYSEMAKAIEHERNIQPAVFSECVYAQSLAQKLSLSHFQNCSENSRLKLQPGLKNSEKLNELTIRYAYSNEKGDETLYQAGGASSVDCALHSETKEELIWIEMKEPYARTSEPDLPKYGEDGFLVSSETFEKNYPQFKSMLEEQLEKRLNVFEHIGNNISEFSESSISKAVRENYAGEKLAHVICTEDEDGMLVMLPSNDVARWSKLEGEIRPSGRNSYKVWTPRKLTETLRKMDGVIENELVHVPLDNLKTSKARGSRNVSRYKINPLFFIRHANVKISNKTATFLLSDVKQLNPSITAKMKFTGLDVAKVKEYYTGII